MADMIIRSRGFNPGFDGVQITFVGILNDGEGFVLYRYEVPHAVAIKTAAGIPSCSLIMQRIRLQAIALCVSSLTR